ncbi:MAG: hypothetical protein IPN96_15695 [Anaerolineales bacterium]|nr:hypothetical protein [Anaerolineales bacterium]
MTTLDRLLLLLTVFLAAYQIVVGIDNLSTEPIIAYTIAFGVLLLAGLLLIILGFEVLDSPVVVIVSTIIPLALSLGLIWEHLASYRTLYLIFTIIGFAAVTLTRAIPMQNKLPTITVAIVHGISGVTIFLLPILLSAQGIMKPAFALVGIGGALIGLGGLILSFFRTGHPVFSKETILRVFSSLLLLATIFFVAGFKLG